MKLLLTHIRELLQVREQPPAKVAGKAMRELPTIKDAWLLIDGETIAAYGPMKEPPTVKSDQVIDCTDRVVLPAWCDSHSH
ncbi:MAG: imidazolonepropionase, partial [Flavobacteriaceae bacterium]|nr:imidazolonepropionase [Flavobacteriaceae bacterium]